ncbi:MAG: hypothetical protein ACW99U_17975 [Candidatus Thorarchaeota archaeon]
MVEGEVVGDLDISVKELESMKGLLEFLAGIIVIVLSQPIFYVAAFSGYWISVGIFGVSPVQAQYPSTSDLTLFAIIFSCGIALVLLAIFWLAPVRSRDMNDGLVRAAGLILLVFPIVPLGQRSTFESPSILVFGFEINNWFLFSLIGLVFLFLPTIRESSRLKMKSGSSVQIVILGVGLIIILLSILVSAEISEMQLFTTPFSFLFLTSGVVPIVHTIIQRFLPNEIGIKSDTEH